MLQSQGMVKFFCIFQLKLTKLNSDVYCERLSISLTGALNCKIKKKSFGAIFYNSKHNTENSEKQFCCPRLGICTDIMGTF